MNYETSACRAANDSGFVPVNISFHCTHSQTGQTGCFAQTSFKLNQPNGAGNYPFLCSQSTTQYIPSDGIAMIMSGVKLDTGSPMNHRNVFAELNIDSYNPVNSEVVWSGRIEWENVAGAMIDTFDATLHGRIFRTATSALSVRTATLNCSGASSSSTQQTVTLPTNHVFGGVAMNRFSLTSTGSNYGVAPTRLATSVSDVSAQPGSVAIKTTCTLGGATSMTCSNRAVVISGVYGSVQKTKYNFSATTSNAGVAPGANIQPPFNEATGSIANMNCGLRSFDAREENYVPRSYQSLWVGQASSDCNWTPGNRYTGQLLFGYQNLVNFDHFEITSTADAVRMP